MTSYDILQNHLRKLSEEMDGILKKLSTQPDLTAEALTEMRNRYVELQNTVHFVGTYCNTIHPPKIVPAINGEGRKLIN